MGGVDKSALEVDGGTLLERSLAAVSAAAEVVVVGGRRPTSRQVTWTVEDPPSGGPAAAVLAGLDALRLDVDVVVVLAVDMPRVGAQTVGRLVAVAEADPTADGALLVAPDGRRQPLAAAYRRAALGSARPAGDVPTHGMPMRRLIASLRLREVTAVGEEAQDIDTWADLRRLSTSADS